MVVYKYKQICELAQIWDKQSTFIQEIYKNFQSVKDMYLNQGQVPHTPSTQNLFRKDGLPDSQPDSKNGKKKLELQIIGQFLACKSDSFCQQIMSLIEITRDLQLNQQKDQQMRQHLKIISQGYNLSLCEFCKPRVSHIKHEFCLNYQKKDGETLYNNIKWFLAPCIEKWCQEDGCLKKNWTKLSERLIKGQSKNIKPAIKQIKHQSERVVQGSFSQLIDHKKQESLEVRENCQNGSGNSEEDNQIENKKKKKKKKKKKSQTGEKLEEPIKQDDEKGGINNENGNKKSEECKKEEEFPCCQIE